MHLIPPALTFVSI